METPGQPCLIPHYTFRTYIPPFIGITVDSELDVFPAGRDFMRRGLPSLIHKDKSSGYFTVKGLTLIFKYKSIKIENTVNQSAIVKK